MNEEWDEVTRQECPSCATFDADIRWVSAICFLLGVIAGLCVGVKVLQAMRL